MNASFSSDLGPFLAVEDDVSEFIICNNDPFSCLSDLLSTFLLEHLDEILLNTTLNDHRVLLRKTVDDGSLDSDAGLLLGVEGNP